MVKDLRLLSLNFGLPLHRTQKLSFRSDGHHGIFWQTKRGQAILKAAAGATIVRELTGAIMLLEVGRKL